MKEENDDIANDKLYNWLKRLKELNRLVMNEQNTEDKKQRMQYLIGYIESLEFFTP